VAKRVLSLFCALVFVSRKVCMLCCFSFLFPLFWMLNVEEVLIFGVKVNCLILVRFRILRRKRFNAER
jgi:hypothetical protein